MVSLFQKFILLQSSVFDFLFYPVRTVSPFYGLLWISALTGLCMVVIYKFVSNQEAISNIKKTIKLHFLEVRLYKDDLTEILDAQKNIIKASFRYMGLSFWPGTVLVCVVFFILIQLHMRFSFQPLRVGKSVCIGITLSEPALEAKINLPKEIRKDSAPFRIPKLNEINWRIVPEKEGLYNVFFNVNGKKIEKKLIVSDGNKIMINSPKKVLPGLENLIEYPAEPFIKSNIPVKEIFVSLLPQEIKITEEKSYNWLMIFFPAAMIFALIFKKLLGIS